MSPTKRRLLQKLAARRKEPQGSEKSATSNSVLNDSNPEECRADGLEKKCHEAAKEILETNKEDRLKLVHKNMVRIMEPKARAFMRNSFFFNGAVSEPLPFRAAVKAAAIRGSKLVASIDPKDTHMGVPKAVVQALTEDNSRIAREVYDSQVITEEWNATDGRFPKGTLLPVFGSNVLSDTVSPVLAMGLQVVLVCPPRLLRIKDILQKNGAIDNDRIITLCPPSYVDNQENIFATTDGYNKEEFMKQSNNTLPQFVWIDTLIKKCPHLVGNCVLLLLDSPRHSASLELPNDIQIIHKLSPVITLVNFDRLHGMCGSLALSGLFMADARKTGELKRDNPNMFFVTKRVFSDIDAGYYSATHGAFHHPHIHNLHIFFEPKLQEKFQTQWKLFTSMKAELEDKYPVELEQAVTSAWLVAAIRYDLHETYVKAKPLRMESPMSLKNGAIYTTRMATVVANLLETADKVDDMDISLKRLDDESCFHVERRGSNGITFEKRLRRPIAYEEAFASFCLPQNFLDIHILKQWCEGLTKNVPVRIFTRSDHPLRNSIEAVTNLFTRWGITLLPTPSVMNNMDTFVMFECHVVLLDVELSCMETFDLVDSMSASVSFIHTNKNIAKKYNKASEGFRECLVHCLHSMSPVHALYFFLLQVHTEQQNKSFLRWDPKNILPPNVQSPFQIDADAKHVLLEKSAQV